MKIALFYATFLAAATTGTEAFNPFANLRMPNLSTFLSETKTSASIELVKEAMEISKKYGATSPEARVAWEAVEEVQANDNRYVWRTRRESCSVSFLVVEKMSIPTPHQKSQKGESTSLAESFIFANQ